MKEDMHNAIINAFGTVPDKAIEVKNGYEVICAHIPNDPIIHKGVNDFPLFEEIDKKIIKLQQYHTGEKIIGWLGYCYTCEKTYYRY